MVATGLMAPLAIDEDNSSEPLTPGVNFQSYTFLTPQSITTLHRTPISQSAISITNSKRNNDYQNLLDFDSRESSSSRSNSIASEVSFSNERSQSVAVPMRSPSVKRKQRRQSEEQRRKNHKLRMQKTRQDENYHKKER